MKKKSKNLLALGSLAFLLFFCGTAMKVIDDNRMLTDAEVTNLTAGEVCCEECRNDWDDAVCTSIGTACETKSEASCEGNGYVAFAN